MKINNFVIHELIKEQHKEIKPSNIRPDVLDRDNDIVNLLISNIAKLYGKRHNTAHYGIFKEKEGRGSFPDNFEKYSKLETPDDEQFLKLTKSAMDSLYEQAQNVLPASGGYMLYVDYLDSQGHFFMVAMIKQKAGITLSKELKPEELMELDLGRLHQAARINFKKMETFLTADATEKQNINYLSFITDIPLA
jgi:nucleoid-associated protein